MNLESHIGKILRESRENKNSRAPMDYFSWGRDPRHKVDNTETLARPPKSKSRLRGVARRILIATLLRCRLDFALILLVRRKYSAFEESYRLMSDDSSRKLFAELVLMALISENNMRLSSYTHEFIKNYEAASAEILSSNDTLNVYQWVLRRVTLNHPSVAMYTTPVVLALHKEGRLYRYKKGDVCIEVSKGDTLIDAGIGWGDTTIYLAQLADAPSGGHSYAFDILEQGIAALGEQLQLNPAVKNITPILGALSDKDGEKVNISPPSPGASIVYEDTGSHALTITIDQFVKSNDIKKIDFIKMDIEGAEVPALKGAVNVIKLFKPKLAISAYHKWDDLLEIPMLINNMRSDYNYYLDCTTGFGGEAVLYCK